MKYPFDESEARVGEFEDLLKSHNIIIQDNSDLESVCLAVMEVNAKHKNEEVHDNQLDIRETFSDVAGIVEFIDKILKHKDHADFNQVVPHLRLMSEANTAVLTTKSKVTDAANNKLLELYVALLCMSFASEIRLDDPEDSKGDNPDVMFKYRDQDWAIACKALHSINAKTLYDTLSKGVEQINRSEAEKGIVLVNFKNIINRDQLWPIINPEQVKAGADPQFDCFDNINTPVDILKSYGKNFHKEILEEVGDPGITTLHESGKCSPGFLVFLQAVTSVQHENLCPPTILKLFDLVQFETVDDAFKELAEKLNCAMHNRCK